MQACATAMLPAMTRSQIASRTLRQHIDPKVLLKVDLAGSGAHAAPHVPTSHRAAAQESVLLQTDPATLQHLIQQLEVALRESSTSSARRVMRNIK